MIFKIKRKNSEYLNICFYVDNGNLPYRIYSVYTKDLDKDLRFKIVGYDGADRKEVRGTYSISVKEFENYIKEKYYTIIPITEVPEIIRNYKP